jgi:endoglucanase
MIEEKFYRLWYQVGTKLACKSSLVAFEPINEPPCNTATDAAEINKLNKIFLQAINDAGGFNPKRVVTLVGGGEDSIKTSEWFVAPTGFSNPYAIQFHYYSPCEYRKRFTTLDKPTDFFQTTSSSAHGKYRFNLTMKILS